MERQQQAILVVCQPQFIRLGSSEMNLILSTIYSSKTFEDQFFFSLKNATVKGNFQRNHYEE